MVDPIPIAKVHNGYIVITIIIFMRNPVLSLNHGLISFPPSDLTAFQIWKMFDQQNISMAVIHFAALVLPMNSRYFNRRKKLPQYIAADSHYNRTADLSLIHSTSPVISTVAFISVINGLYPY